jgi:NAD(P)-dependent dehydrogenase (short-subunit alcohol dehydrogenase family)
MQRQGQPVSPAAVEKSYTRLLNAREIRHNLAAIRQAGARVHYHQVDVRDDLALGYLIEDIYDTHGRLDGVIHGAGVIDDKLIEDKSPDSFDRVLDTKVSGAFTLGWKLRFDSLRFLVLFSSVAGRFGNRGQSDYAAANEILNKLAVVLDRRCPGRVVAIGWGPWRGAGMVSAEVERQFAERSVPLIDPQEGVRALDRELRLAGKGDVEVIIGKGPWEAVEAARPSVPHGPFPLLDGVRSSAGGDGSIEVLHDLDPAIAPYLLDHQLDGCPVLPAAMALELMAEVVQHQWPGWKIIGAERFRVFKGIVLHDGPRTVRVMARPQTQPSPERPEAVVHVEIQSPGASAPAHYRAWLRLAREWADPPPFRLPSDPDLEEFPVSADEAYRQLLFHGPRFRCIARIEGTSRRGMVADLVSSSPRACLACAGNAEWLVDPIIVDSAFQLAIIWARVYWDMTALPSSFQGYSGYGSLSGPALRCHFEVLSGSGLHCLRAAVRFFDPQGRLLGLLEGLECTCSKSLNRLASSKAGP